MSFHVLNIVDDSVMNTVERGDFLDLEASKSIYIPALCVATIPHDTKIAIMKDGLVWISRIPGIFMSHNLFVDSGMVNSGMIVTEVFNLSNQRVYIKAGDSISRLVAL